MNSQPAALRILSAPVALCDRRALSEAWYSALHMHKNAPPRASRVAASPGGGHEEFRSPFSRSRAGTLEAGIARPGRAVPSGAAAALPGAPSIERRTARSRLAQNIVRTFAKTASPPRHASFCLEGNRGRVQILLRESAGRTQIVALCPPSAGRVVAVALQQARYALALRGISLATEVRGFAR